MAGFRHDQVIQHGHADSTAGLLDLKGHGHIRLRGFRIAGRVIMDQHDAGGTQPQCPARNFARMHRGGIDRAAAQHLVPQQPPVAGQKQRVQVFDLRIGERRPAIAHQSRGFGNGGARRICPRR